jgi:ATP-dependent Clp protease ATP-binding subunit ClpC
MASSASRGTRGRIDVFERFTDRARRVVVLAQEEARLLDHNYIGTEHLLLGLIQEQDGVAAKALVAMGVRLETVRSQVEEMIGRGHDVPRGHIPFTPRAKKVLELSLREALQLGHNYIGTEHILLGLVREGDGVAAQVLNNLMVNLDRVRQTVIQLLSGYQASTGEPHPSERVPGAISEPAFVPAEGQSGPRCPGCRGELAETAVHRTLEVPSEEEDGETVSVRLLFCKTCGRALGTTIL